MTRTLFAQSLLLIAFLFPAFANADDSIEQVAKLLPGNVIAVLRIDVNTAADPKIYDSFANDLGDEKMVLLNMLKRSATDEFCELKKLGATTLHIGISMNPDVSIVVSAKNAEAAKAASDMIASRFHLKDSHITASEGTNVSLTPKHVSLKLNENISKTLATHVASPIVLALAPTSDHKRVLSELVAGNEDKSILVLKSLSRLERGALFIETKPKARSGYEFISENEEAATELAKSLTQLVRVESETKVAKTRATRFAVWAKDYEFSANGKKVAGVIEDSPALLDLATAMISDTRRDAFRMQTMNDLKQLALAFHNYADSHKKFPTQAIYSKDGKPLLSWRVALLPYLDYAELYDKFHLDEPWDSPHNKKLIPQMPPIFEPRQDAAADEIGRTSYVAPIGEKSLFSFKKTLFFKDVVDGTSATMLFMVAPKDKHVIWTKPDDLPVDYSKTEASVFGDRKELPFCMLDGSAHIWTRIGSDDNLRRLIQINDRELVKQQ